MGLSKSTQIQYASLELGVSAVESYLRLYLLIFLTTKLGLSPQLAGYAVAIGILWDAFADPLMGKISDKTASRWGQRIPWMILGTPLLMISFVFLFSAASMSEWPPSLIFIGVTLLNIVLNTAMTMVSIPHLALGQDIAKSPDDRTSIYAWRTLMTLLGLLVGIAVPVIAGLLNLSLSERESALIIGGLLLFSALISVLGALKFAVKSDSVPQSLDSGPGFHWSQIFGRGFVFLFLAFYFATFAQGLNSAIAMFYYKYTLGLTEQDLGIVLLVFILSLCLTLPLWVFAAKKVAKQKLIAWGTLLLGLASIIVYPALPAHSLIGPIAMAIVGGALLGSSGLLESLLVDVSAAQHVTDRQMGQVFGLWKFTAKFARATAIAGGGQLLALTGFESQKTAFSDATLYNIALLFGPGVGVLFVVGAVILLKSETKGT
ncbi:MAG: MFS transporter [Proteobacteria bacterium]|nr:MFS transporter [Pseudomonadota bacterium]